MTLARASLLIAWLGAALAARSGAGADSPAAPLFEKDVEPIFSRRCAECHGISKQSGGVRLDAFEQVLKGGRKGQVVIPGKSAQSRVIELITAEGKKRMPPKGDRVPAEEVEVIRRWIDGGARSAPSAAGAAELQLQKLPAGFGPVLAVAGDGEGKRLAFGRGAAVVVVRLAAPPVPAGAADAAASKNETILDAGADAVQSLAFSPNGKLLASGGFREVLVWETEGWTLQRRLSPFVDRVLALDFSPSGDLLAAGGGLPSQTGEVMIWQVRTGKLMKALPDVHSDTVFGLDFSPDGTRLATASADRMVHLVDIGSGKRLARFEGHTNHVLGAAFSPDGKKLFTAGADNKVKTWDIEKGESVKDWNGHGKAVSAIAIAPDGKVGATVSGDRTLRLWNPENGGQLRSHNEAKDYLYAVAIFGNGKLIAASGRDAVVRLYDAKENKLLASFEPPTVLP